MVVRRVSVCRFVVAGGAAGFAVHEAVGAEAHVELGLAVHAEFVAPATLFRALALGADDAAYAWSRGHGCTLARADARENVTEVTKTR